MEISSSFFILCSFLASMGAYAQYENTTISVESYLEPLYVMPPEMMVKGRSLQPPFKMISLRVVVIVNADKNGSPVQENKSVSIQTGYPQNVSLVDWRICSRCKLVQESLYTNVTLSLADAVFSRTVFEFGFYVWDMSWSSLTFLTSASLHHVAADFYETLNKTENSTKNGIRPGSNMFRLTVPPNTQVRAGDVVKVNITIEVPRTPRNARIMSDVVVSLIEYIHLSADKCAVSSLVLRKRLVEYCIKSTPPTITPAPVRPDSMFHSTLLLL